MADQRFPGPRHHTSMNGRVSWNCVPLHSRAASPAALDVPRAIRDALNEPPFGHRIKGRPAEGEGYCTCGYGTEDDHFDSIEEHIAKVVAARLTKQEERP